MVSLLLLLLQTEVDMVHRPRAPGCVHALHHASGTQRVQEKGSRNGCMDTENRGGGEMYGAETDVGLVHEDESPGTGRSKAVGCFLRGVSLGKGNNKMLRGDSSLGPKHQRSYFKALSRESETLCFPKDQKAI